MEFSHRYIAQIIVEAVTPLAIGSDLLEYDQDSPVDKDFNGLPYIPGTAIAGYLRKKSGLDAIFGEDPESKAIQPKGSNIITSDAFLMDKAGKVLQEPTEITDEFLKHYFNLPIRQHTAINEYGAAKDSSKFDTEIVYKGSRFKFEIELQLSEKKDDDWEEILNTFFRNDFYLGSGEFNNFGELKVFEIKQRYFNLNNDLDAYLNHDVDLNSIGNGFEKYTNKISKQPYTEKTLELSGKNSFFHFGAGFGDFEADNINYTEDVVDWKNNNPDFIKHYVIPGTSIKGALAHRVAFHYNKEKDNTVESILENIKQDIKTDLDKKYNLNNFVLADDIETLKKQKQTLETELKTLENEKINTSNLFEKYLGENNKAVKALFGAAKQSEKTEKDQTANGQSGQIIIKDIYLKAEDYTECIFMHNKIDRYTGGTIESALFNEKVLAIDEIELCYKYKEKTNLTYFKEAVEDLKKGMLPLGGLVNKGHGIFELKTDENGK